jgi:hypothetical protein
MATEARIKSLAGGIRRLPGARQLLRRLRLRDTLARLLGARYLNSGTALAPWKRVHPYDVAHGTDTSGFVPVNDLDQLDSEAARAQAGPYGGSQPSILRTILAALPSTDSFTFVDLGCGKGRPLLVASEFPFRDIVGVELSAPLAKIAQQNARLIAECFSERRPIRVVVGDASAVALPAGNLILYLYNPFGEEAISRVADAVSAAVKQQGRTVYVVYYNPVFGHRFDVSPHLRRHFASTLPYAAEELGYGPDTEDPVVVWHGGIAFAPAEAGADARIEMVEPNRVRLLSA